MEDFRYDNLPNPGRHIRLVRIELENIPQASIPIDCKMQTFPADDDIIPEYLALSYVWGDARDTVPIALEGKRKSVTKNLFSALQHLKYLQVTKWVWIDALCINQDDEVEKSRQVERMNSTFSQADMVIAWLGPAANQSDIIFDTMETIAEKFITLENGGHDCVKALSNHRAGDEDIAPEAATFIREINDIIEEGLFPLVEVGRLFLRPFWSRIWILQEVLLAQELFFVCGHKKITFDTFFFAYHVSAFFVRTFEGNAGHEYSRFLPHISPPMHMVFEHKLRRNRIRRRSPTENCSFVEHLRRARLSFQASNPLDMVYALLGISSDALELGITVDYAEEFEACYTKVAQKLLHRFGLCVLSWAEGINRQICDLPSWVPDWRTRQASPISNNWKPFNWTATGFRPLYQHSDSPTPSIIVEGHRLDKVSKVGTHFQVSLARDPMESVTAWFGELAELACEANNVADLDEIKEAIVKTSFGHDFMEDNPNIDFGTILRVCNPKVLCDATLTEELRIKKAADTISSIACVAEGRRGFLSEGGYVGLGPQMMEAGDAIVAMPGWYVPLVLRQRENGGYNFLGEAYVYKLSEDGVEGLPWESFRLC